MDPCQPAARRPHDDRQSGRSELGRHPDGSLCRRPRSQPGSGL